MLNACELFIIDDGSPNTMFDHRVAIFNALELPDTLKSKVNLIHFKDHLGRLSISDYPGWWRSFSFSIKLAEKYGFDKMIHIESDFYIVSRKMFDYIQKLSVGWTAFYSRYYDFAETAIQVICRDSFDSFNKIYCTATHQDYRFSEIAEYVIPFTNIEKNFYGDRFGERNVLQEWVKRKKMPIDIDYIGQLSTYSNIKDYKNLFKL